MKSSDRIKHVVEFASIKHKNQLRRSGEPYFEHLRETGELTATICDQLEASGHGEFCPLRREDLVTASYLHDAIEDTNSSYDDIVEVAGDRVASWVSILTDDKRLPRAVRRQQYLVHLSAASIEVKIVKLADVLSNLRALRGTEGKEWIEQFIQKCKRYLGALEYELGSTACFQEAQEIIAHWYRKLVTDTRNK